MISNLSRRFRIDVVDVPSSDSDIQALIEFSPVQIPKLYLEMIRSGSDFEILVDNEIYVRFWGAASCLDMNVGYQIQKYLGPCIAIGDDEGGKALVLMPETRGFPPGLYLSSFGCLDIQESKYIAASLNDFLINGIGAERIYE